MKSPITGKEMKRKIREDQLVFRKETFDYLHHYYLCEDTNEEFTNEELDALNLTQVYNQYREKYNLPFPDEIKSIREQYGLSAAKMAEVLGLGTNLYRLYENGEVPSISNARLIQAAKDPDEFKKFLLSSGALKGTPLSAILDKIDVLMSHQHSFIFSGLPDYLMGVLTDLRPGAYTGFVTPDLSKVIELVVFFAGKMNVLKTKLNKLLFYADFIHYRNTGFGITGLSYRAIQWGPVPANYESIYEYAASRHFIEILYQEFDSGKCGEQFLPGPEHSFNPSLFTNAELQTAQYVIDKFRNTSTKEIITISHQERGWIENIDKKNKISYDFAFDLVNA
jgi:transcriptional regulator with XRE-family HTH domain/uncharacterized phage-associated protein